MPTPERAAPPAPGRGASPEPEYDQAADRGAHVALELGLRHARGLEVELVEHRRASFWGMTWSGAPAARPERHAQPDHAAEAIRPQQRGVPCDRRAPVVAGDDRGRLAERVEQPDHVADQMEQRVLVDRLRRVGLAVAAHVGRHRVVAGIGQRRAAGAATSTSTRGSRGTASRAGPSPARRRACGCRWSRRSGASISSAQSVRPLAVPAAVFSPCWFSHQTSTTTRVRPAFGLALLHHAVHGERVAGQHRLDERHRQLAPLTNRRRRSEVISSET